MNALTYGIDIGSDIGIGIGIDRCRSNLSGPTFNYSVKI